MKLLASIFLVALILFRKINFPIFSRGFPIGRFLFIFGLFDNDKVLATIFASQYFEEIGIQVLEEQVL